MKRLYPDHPDPAMRALRGPEELTQALLKRLFVIDRPPNHDETWTRGWPTDHVYTHLFLRKVEQGRKLKKVGTPDKKGYVFIKIDGIRHSAGRLMWLYHEGYLPWRVTYENGYINDYSRDNLIELYRKPND